MDIAETIRKQVKDAVERAARTEGVNVASATNVAGSGHTTSVYSDDEVTVVERDGETQVIRHGEKGTDEA